MSKRRDRYEETAKEFGFEQDDTVLVTVREDGMTGPIQGKFIAHVVGFTGPQNPEEFGSTRVVLSPAWSDSVSAGISLKFYEAGFEVVDDVDEVSF